MSLTDTVSIMATQVATDSLYMRSAVNYGAVTDTVSVLLLASLLVVTLGRLLK